MQYSTKSLNCSGGGSIFFILAKVTEHFNGFKIETLTKFCLSRNTRPFGACKKPSSLYNAIKTGSLRKLGLHNRYLLILVVNVVYNKVI